MASMAKSKVAAPEIPGLRLVGRGIYVNPNRPYELKRVLFLRNQVYTHDSIETGQSYSVPEGYAVNHSPPMPAGQALNQTVIEESWHRLDKQLNLDANIAASNQLFTIDASFNQAEQMRAEEDSYYAMRSSFLPLWTVYVTNEKDVSDADLKKKVKTPFKHQHRREYEDFFERNGTHYVKRVWVGGKATVVFTVAKSSNMTMEDIKAGIKASYGKVSGGISTGQEEKKERLQEQSECAVYGQGGHEVTLAALSTLDEESYNNWLDSIRENPQAIELEVAGIWTLLKDQETAETLRKAYKEATSFSPISAIFELDRFIYLFRSDRYFRYNTIKKETELPNPLFRSDDEDAPKGAPDPWASLKECGYSRIEAVFRGNHVHDADGNPMPRKLFFFQGTHFVRYDVDTQQVDHGPTPIAEGWPGVPFESIDAVLSVNSESIYFFSGDRYVRYNGITNRVDEGYPASVRERWIGMTFDRIDAALYGGHGKCYFFSETRYIRYDIVNYRADAGYPKFIDSNYIEDWKFFD